MPEDEGFAKAAGALRGDRRNLAIVAAMAASFAALFLSTEHALWPFFAIAVILSGYFITHAFARTWGYVVWLAFVYVLVFVGSVMFLVLSRDGLHFYLTGILVEGFALFIIYSLIRRVKDARDVGGKSQYTPLGLWSVALLAFFILSNFSVLAWASWAEGRIHVAAYLVFESLMVLSLFFVLYVPENMEEKRSAITETVAKGGRKRRAKEKCPACGSSMDLEVRLCPECGTPKEFMWCPDSEEYIDRCPKCGELITLGSKRCSKCGTALHKGVTCDRCKMHAAISDWKGVRPS